MSVAHSLKNSELLYTLHKQKTNNMYMDPKPIPVDVMKGSQPCY